MTGHRSTKPEGLSQRPAPLIEPSSLAGYKVLLLAPDSYLKEPAGLRGPAPKHLGAPGSRRPPRGLVGPRLLSLASAVGTSPVFQGRQKILQPGFNVKGFWPFFFTRQQLEEYFTGRGCLASARPIVKKYLFL